MTDLVDRARGALHAQPFSVLLGTELMHVGAGELTLRLPVRDELRQQHALTLMELGFGRDLDVVADPHLGPEPFAQFLGERKAAFLAG